MLNKSRKEDAGLTSILTPRKTIRLATWNIRTMQKAGRTEKVAKAIVSRDWVRQGGWDRIYESDHRRNTFVFRTHCGDCLPHWRCSLEAQRAPIGWEPVNSRIITAKFKTKKIKIKLNIIQCYPFTSNYRHSWIKQGIKKDIKILNKSTQVQGYMNKNSEIFADPCFLNQL